MSRLCLICDKPLAECNKRPICFCHENEGRLSDRQIAELRKQNGHPENTKEESKEKAMRGTCKNCGRANLSIAGKGLCGSCYNALLGVPPENHETVLAACRERLAGKGKLGGGPKKKDDAEPIPPCAPQARAVITAGKRKSGEGQKPAKVESFGVPCTIKVYVEEKEILAVAGRIEVEAA